MTFNFSVKVWFSDGTIQHNSFDAAANNFNDVSLGSEHGGGTNLLMVDGHVRYVAESLDTIVLKSAASINGGEIAMLD